MFLRKMHSNNTVPRVFEEIDNNLTSKFNKLNLTLEIYQFINMTTLN